MWLAIGCSYLVKELKYKAHAFSPLPVIILFALIFTIGHKQESQNAKMRKNFYSFSYSQIFNSTQSSDVPNTRTPTYTYSYSYTMHFNNTMACQNFLLLLLSYTYCAYQIYATHIHISCSNNIHTWFLASFFSSFLYSACLSMLEICSFEWRNYIILSSFVCF